MPDTIDYHEDSRYRCVGVVSDTRKDDLMIYFIKAEQFKATAFRFRLLSLFIISITLLGCSGSTSSNNFYNEAGAITLTWYPPTENTNGEPLTNLIGYKIYYSTSPSLIDFDSFYLDGPGVTSFIIDKLQNNVTYFIVITAINSENRESIFSNVVSVRA